MLFRAWVICTSYNSGVSFSRTSKPFLQDVIIRKNRTSASRSLCSHTAALVSVYIDRNVSLPWLKPLWCPTHSLTFPLKCQIEFSLCWTLFPIAIVYYWFKSALPLEYPALSLTESSQLFVVSYLPNSSATIWFPDSKSMLYLPCRKTYWPPSRVRSTARVKLRFMRASKPGQGKTLTA